MKVKVLYARNIDHPFPVVAWLIMLFQKMNPFKKDSYNHVALYYIGQDGKETVLDATGKHGVKIRTKETFDQTYRVTEEDVLTIPTNAPTFVAWASTIAGRKYDRLQVLGLFLKNVLSFVSFNSIGHNDRKIICNEVVILMLMRFDNLRVKDSDNYDLLDTRKIVKQRV